MWCSAQSLSNFFLSSPCINQLSGSRICVSVANAGACLCSIDVRFKLKLLIHTYRCTHALASSLLCQQYKLRSYSNSTHSTIRSQLTLSLCIPSAARRPGTISPLFTSTLLWNSLPSPIRSASSLHTFRQELQKYLGIPVIRPR